MSTFGLHLNTRDWSNVKVTQRLDPYEIPTISNSAFDVNKDTKLLIHGFTDIYDWPWWTVRTLHLQLKISFFLSKEILINTRLAYLLF